MTSRNDSTHGWMLFKVGVAAAGMLLAAYLLWELQRLIVPIAVSGLLAYICRPIVAGLERYRAPRGVALGLLLFVFVLAALVIVNRINALMPTENEVLELKVRSLYKLNEHYKALMGLDQSLTKGNRLYRLVHADVDPLMDRVNELLALTPDEHYQFLASRSNSAEALAGSDRPLYYHRANLNTHRARGQAALAEPDAAGRAHPGAVQPGTPVVQTPPATLGDLFSTWIIAPLVFLFLLRDTGEIKRGLLRAVPNRLFEPALTVLADLDHALGDYLRGLSLECLLLGVTVALLFAIIGVPLRWAIVIGLFAGVTNVVPYVGSVVALLAGIAYALLAEDIHPLLPIVDTDNLAIWVIVAVALAELIKNAIYEPLVLGGAVNLHPLVIVIGVVGGSIMFGFVGVLLAVPTITVFKVFVSSTAKQLKAYGLI